MRTATLLLVFASTPCLFSPFACGNGVNELGSVDSGGGLEGSAGHGAPAGGAGSASNGGTGEVGGTGGTIVSGTGNVGGVGQVGGAPGPGGAPASGETSTGGDSRAAGTGGVGNGGVNTTASGDAASVGRGATTDTGRAGATGGSAGAKADSGPASIVYEATFNPIDTGDIVTIMKIDYERNLCFWVALARPPRLSSPAPSTNITVPAEWQALAAKGGPGAATCMNQAPSFGASASGQVSWQGDLRPSCKLDVDVVMSFDAAGTDAGVPPSESISAQGLDLMGC